MWQDKKRRFVVTGIGSNSSFPKWSANNGNVNRKKIIEERDKK